MILNPFLYSAPDTMQEAISLLSVNGSELFTGDQAHVGNAKRGTIKPTSIISLRKVPGLKSITQNGSKLEIGSAVTFGSLLSNSAVDSVSVLTDALKAIKDPHLRNHSNIGGAFYLNAPAHAPVLAAFLALNALVNVTGREGNRQILMDDYFKNKATAELTKGEILQSITLDIDSEAQGSFHFIDYLKSGKVVSGVAVVLNQQQNQLSDIRIAVSGCVEIPTRLTTLEEALKGKEINKENVDEALKVLDLDGLIISGMFISNPSYLLHLTKVLIRRAVLKS